MTIANRVHAAEGTYHSGFRHRSGKWLMCDVKSPRFALMAAVSPAEQGPALQEYVFVVLAKTSGSVTKCGKDLVFPPESLAKRDGFREHISGNGSILWAEPIRQSLQGLVSFKKSVATA